MALCLLGVMVLLAIVNLFGENSNISVIIFLLFILAAVSIFVYFSMQSKKYEKIKQEYEGVESESKNQIVDSVCVIIMLSATVIFLVAGFLGNAWNPAWVVFPVGGIICAIVSSLFSIERNKKQESR